MRQVPCVVEAVALVDVADRFYGFRLKAAPGTIEAEAGILLAESVSE